MKKFMTCTFSLVVLIILSSCDKSSTLSMTSEAIDMPNGPDITTKVVDGKTIPDNISGFKMGMNKDEVLTVVAKKKLVKEKEYKDEESNTSSTDFKNATFLGHQAIMTLVSSQTQGIEVISFSLKAVDTATLDDIAEKLAKDFGPPRVSTNDAEARTWSYGIGNYIRAALSSGTIDIRFVFEGSLYPKEN